MTQIKITLVVDKKDFIETCNDFGAELEDVETWDVKQNMEALLSAHFDSDVVAVSFIEDDEDEDSDD